MRTVSPEIWWGRRKKSPISSNFGQKVPNKMETMLRRSFWKTLEEFSRTTHMTGFKYTVDEMASAAKRKMWRYLVFTFIIMGLVTTGFIVHRLRQLPAVTVALPSLEHTIQNIDFPAVAFCSYNLINKTRAWNYAEFLHSKKHRFRRWYKNYSVEDIYKNLVNFGALIDFSLPSIDIDFTEFLQAVDGDRGMNVTAVMLMLTAPCSEQLLHCNWRGRPHDCSELFALRLTQTGFCCIFNGRYQEGDRSNKPYRLDTVGADNGLSVIVHTARDDDAYLRWTGVGTEVILFNGAEYPLMEGGGILAVPAAVNESTFLLLSTVEVDAPSDVHDVSETRRGCKFGKLGETYIQCLTECRRKTIETLCGCVPFQYMPAAGDTLCRLEQLPCLNKYREKLLFYFPKDTDFDPGLQEEFSDSLDCYFCLPDCTRTRYTIDVSVAKYGFLRGHLPFFNYFTYKRRVVNSSIVRLFYSTEGQTLYSLEVTERWYELTSIIGGQCCMIFGITIMLGPEIIYYLTIRWKHHFDILKRRQAI